MKAMPEMLVVLIAVIFLLTAGLASASVAVKQGDRIQAAIDAAQPGEIIEVHSGTYKESLIVDKPLIIKGIDSGSGLAIVQTDRGPAITLKANGIVLESIWAKSESVWTEDAGILVLSNDNILRNNMASGNGNAGIILKECKNNTLSGNVAQGNGNEGIYLKNCSRNLLERNQVKNNKYGIRMHSSFGNELVGNTISGNKFHAIYLQNCQRNIIEGNYASKNEGGLVMDTCRDNIVRKNDFVENELGISISYLDMSNEVQSKGKGVVISYNSMPSESSVSTNNTIYQNNLSNKDNAYDESLDHWDFGQIGNNYSNFNDVSEGCTGKKICSSEYRIPGGPSVDEFPQAAPLKVPGLYTGPYGAVLRIFQTSFVPGGRMRLNYTSPANVEVWADMDTSNESQNGLYLGQNTTGNAVLTAPDKEGSYRLRMHDINGTQIISLPFNVTVPRISASPSSVNTCEKIFVAYLGAFGQNKDWIGMYRAGSSDFISRQYLNGQENGNITFSSSEAGSFEFKLFAAGASAPVATSNAVEVKSRSGYKVIAEPTRVSPGGTVTVTYWGAPSSGTGMMGMYGMNRPDKFPVEKRSIGSKSCGSMTWRLPSAAGQYDFRMFYSDITDINQGAYQLLAQSNVVTVS